MARICTPAWASRRFDVRRLPRPIRTILLSVAANQAALYNLRTAAGNPAGRVNVLCTINSGIVLQAGFTTGAGWNNASKLKLVNKGSVCGIGGARTVTTGDGGDATAGVLNTGRNGQAGGDAIDLGFDLTIDNTDGYVLGGGGQGGGGGATAASNPPAGNQAAPGGGGGGGRGYNNAAGGVKGGNNGTAVDAVNGGAGSSASYGAGGAGGQSGIGNGGAGGRGGDWGEAGAAGVTPANVGRQNTAAGLGGAAGRAVKLNGRTVTWLGGNNSTQVKGAVS